MKYKQLGTSLFLVKFKEIENGNFEKFLKDYDLGLRIRVIASYEN